MSKIAGVIGACLVAICAGCAGEDANVKFQKAAADEQLRKGQREKDLRVVSGAFEAYVQAYGPFERRLVALIHCGESQFVADHRDQAFQVFLGFMMERVEDAMKDREPIRVRASESDAERQMKDAMEGMTLVRASDLLEREGYIVNLRQAYDRGTLEAYFEMSGAERASLCSKVELYKVEVISVIEQHAKSMAARRTSSGATPN